MKYCSLTTKNFNTLTMKNYYQETFFCTEENQEKKEKTKTESTEIQQDADEVVKPGGDIPKEKN